VPDVGKSCALVAKTYFLTSSMSGFPRAKAMVTTLMLSSGVLKTGVPSTIWN
jgi:hypothetical protein